ncbi:MAG TPA: alpha/beta hydrolase family protein, partial [Pyrinomonadaceae bacterium]|nr:alpha/beta hydrolase family protein [Pyrinomonadaceae bacterium]
ALREKSSMRIIKLSKAFLFSFVFCVSVLANGRVQTVRFQSKLVNTILPYNVILPADYQTSTTTRYPVLYLLHGLTGHYSDWVARTNVADYAATYRMIVITPEGNAGWYTDSTIGTDKYESYILNELIPDVQQRYRTIEARYGRSIAGLSMGGYGAIKFGLKSPATFVFAASMSGVFNVTRLTEKETPESWIESLKLFGPAGSETRRANDPFEMIEKVTPARVSALPYFYFDCGTEDLLLIFHSNRELAALMVEKKIPHEYRQLPGDHSWAYWDRQVQEILKLAAEKMRQPKRISRA